MKPALAFVLSVAFLLSGPSLLLALVRCTPAERAEITIADRDMAPAFACVASAVALYGVEDPIAVASTCGGMTIADIEKATAGILAASSAPLGEGGAPASFEHVRRAHARAIALLVEGGPGPLDGP
jgi:hypothetical protein